MPVTPFHVFPAATVYFLFFRRLNGLAFFFGTLLIDLEPFLYVFLGSSLPQIPLLLGGYAQQGLHMITHNPFSAIFLVAPAMVLLKKLVELSARGFLTQILPGAEWIGYSLKQTYLSALLGTSLHLGWDVTMHRDINLGFPFVNISNPLVSPPAYTMIFLISFVMIIPAYFIGKRATKSSPFKKLP
jgi:hypothetical protein